MYIKSILKFISDLERLKELIPYDILLLNKITNHIIDRPADEELVKDDFTFLLKCFKDRWLKIINTQNDYMLNAGIVNQRWIEFAKEIAPFTDRNYLRILLPTVTNTQDFNNLTRLTDTVRLQNFFLGDEDGLFLYRKRGLCELLIQNNFILATRRELNSSRLCAMTVEEMSRLEACKQSDGQFSIKEEQFKDFWEFLRKKVFPQLQSAQLQSKEEMPFDLLAQLLLLIEQYYTLKETRASYKLFNDLVNDFFKCIYKNKMRVINFFYGMTIPDTDLYLLDFLIVIYKADGYVLDRHWNVLMKWLYQIHPSLRVMNEEFDFFYKKLQMSGGKVDSSLVPVKNKSECLLDQCLRLLLSLYTIEFDFIPLTGKIISFWDISRTVFAEADEIYSLLAPMLEKNKIEELLEQYQKVIKEYIIPGRLDSSIFTWLTRYKVVGEWYIHVENKTLSQLGVNWFQPELILHALLRYKTSDAYVISRINEFLDAVVHTYTQSNCELQKQLRVNILFTDFINTLPFHDQSYLRIVLQLYDKNDTKIKFFNNCITHILNRLSEISIIRAEKPLHFFARIHKADVSKLDISHIGSNDLQKIIEDFKNKLFSSDLNIDGQLLEKMMDFLRNLNRPIITFDERQQETRRSTSLGYVGGYT